MKALGIIGGIIMILTMIYLCIIITLNFNRNDLANVAFNIALMSEREWLDTQNRMRTWELLIDAKVLPCDEVKEFFAQMNAMDWKQFKKWQRMNRSKKK